MQCADAADPELDLHWPLLWALHECSNVAGATTHEHMLMHNIALGLLGAIAAVLHTGLPICKQRDPIDRCVPMKPFAFLRTGRYGRASTTRERKNYMAGGCARHHIPWIRPSSSIADYARAKRHRHPLPMSSSAPPPSLEPRNLLDFFGSLGLWHGGRRAA